MVQEIRDTVSREYLAEHTVLMDFYNEPSSSPEDYAYLFVWCMDNTEECSAEPIAYYLYDMFVRYPAKFRELNHFLEQLPTDNQKEIRIDLMGLIAFEFTLRTDDQKKPPVNEFISRFPYFNTPEYINRYCDPDFL